MSWDGQMDMPDPIRRAAAEREVAAMLERVRAKLPRVSVSGLTLVADERGPSLPLPAQGWLRVSCTNLAIELHGDIGPELRRLLGLPAATDEGSAA